jgi:hypothetical protein
MEMIPNLGARGAFLLGVLAGSPATVDELHGKVAKAYELLEEIGDEGGYLARPRVAACALAVGGTDAVARELAKLKAKGYTQDLSLRSGAQLWWATPLDQVAQ